jgi:putative transposase
MKESIPIHFGTPTGMKSRIQDGRGNGSQPTRMTRRDSFPDMEVHETPKSEYSVKTLEDAIIEHGKPASILSDHGATFYAVESDTREKGTTEFEKCLLKHRIRFILRRVNHPQTNGKIEKFFGIFENKIKWSASIDEFMEWYGSIRPYGALDLKTPVEAYYANMPELDALEYPLSMEEVS